MASCVHHEPMEVDEEEEWAEGGSASIGGTNGEKGEHSDDAYPSNWLRTAADRPVVAVQLAHTTQDFLCVSRQFYLSILEKCPSVKVKRIFRIQSNFLWKHFCLKKAEMKKEHGGLEMLTKQLFHGTKNANIDAICRKGFDWRLCGRHGTKYGQGCYFAQNSAYSHSYSFKTLAGENPSDILQSAIVIPHHATAPSPSPSLFVDSADCKQRNEVPHVIDGHICPTAKLDTGHFLHRASVAKTVIPIPRQARDGYQRPVCYPPTSSHHCYVSRSLPAQPLTSNTDNPQGCNRARYMFLARVLVGSSVRGHCDYRRPPALNPGDPNGPSYDSCVDFTDNPSIYVVFDSNQAYPEFLIEYTD